MKDKRKRGAHRAGEPKRLDRFLQGKQREDFIALSPFDLDALIPNRTRDGLLAVTEESLIVYAEGQETRTVPLSDVSRLVLETSIGSASLLASMKSGETVFLCRGSASYIRGMGSAVKAVNYYIDTQTKESHNGERVGRTCPKCKRPLSRGSSTCAHCQSKMKTFARLYAFARPYRIRLFLAILLFFAVSGIGLLVPRLNKWLVDGFVNNSEASVTGSFIGTFFFAIFLIALAGIAQRLLSFLRGYLLIDAGNRVIVSLRETVFEKIKSMSVARISKRTSGELLNRVTNDTATIQNFITNRSAAILEQIVMFAIVSVILFFYDWRMALLVLLPTPLVVCSFRFFWRKMRGMFHQRWQLGSEANATLHDIFSGIRVVKAYGTEKREAARFDTITKKERDAQIRQEKIWALLMPLITFGMGIGEFILLYFVGNRILEGSMTIGDMAMFSSYVAMVYAPLRSFAHLPREILRVSTATGKLFEILDEELDVSDVSDALDMQINGHIEIKNVSFSYEDGSEVLKNVSIDVKPGEFVGLVGRSGVGKSTLMNLVMRLYDVDSGEILIDGVDIRQIAQDSLRSQIGVVLQESFLFTGSVLQNIAYARPTASREEILHASKLAGCHEFIVKLPDGYHTKIGERGYTLSGGERQRIAIARALLHKPRILILDEATASLDTETEKKIQDALAILTKDCTTIAIAHRLSTLRHASRLVVLDKGTVAEEGTHEELLAKAGLYYQLVMAQRGLNRMNETHGAPWYLRLQHTKENGICLNF